MSLLLRQLKAVRDAVFTLSFFDEDTKSTKKATSCDDNKNGWIFAGFEEGASSLYRDFSMGIKRREYKTANEVKHIYRHTSSHRMAT